MEETAKIASRIIRCFRRGNKLLICGNGGSATQASHFAAEFVNHYLHPISKALPAMALNDPAILTAIANDRGFEFVFSRQIEAYGKLGDILISLSTSGKSKNILNAIKQAKKQKITNIEFPIKGRKTGEIQNYQLALMHEICEFVEQSFI